MNLQRLLIICGLITIPFYELIFRLFPYAQVIAPDTRVTKELVAMMFALAIGLSAVFYGIKPFKNKFALIFVGFLLFNYFMSPFIPLAVDHIDSSNFWFWKPMAKTLCFLLMIVAIASIKPDDKFLLIAMWCGVAMSVYAILQWLGFDQFWGTREGDEFRWVTQPGVAGTMGNSTVAASFIAMLVPIAIYFTKYVEAALMILAVIVTKSDMGVMAILLISILVFIRVYPHLLFHVYGLAFVLMVGASLLFIHNQAFHQYIVNKSSGRTAVWGQVLKDFRDGPIEGLKSDFSFTGAGLGSFPHIFSTRHNSIFKQAHSEPLELLYSCGLIGFGLAVLALFSLFFSVMREATDRSFYLLLSLWAILVCSCGLFVFQLGAHQFYASFIVGLLHNNGRE